MERSSISIPSRLPPPSSVQDSWNVKKSSFILWPKLLDAVVTGDARKDVPDSFREEEEDTLFIIVNAVTCLQKTGIFRETSIFHEIGPTGRKEWHVEESCGGIL